jgi:hypothetical protein
MSQVYIGQLMRRAERAEARVAELEAEREKLIAVERAARTQDIHGLFAALAAVRQEKP